MAASQTILYSAYVGIGGTDYSALFKSVSISEKADENDATTFGSAGWKDYRPGLRQLEGSGTFLHDFSAGGLYAVLYQAANAATPAALSFEIRPTQSARSTSNIAVTGSFYVMELQGVNGEPGKLVECSFSWKSAGQVLHQSS